MKTTVQMREIERAGVDRDRTAAAAKWQSIAVEYMAGSQLWNSKLDG